MLTIRDMTPADLPVYTTMALDFYCGDATLFPVTEQMLADTLAESLKPEQRTRLLMLEEDGIPVGYGNLTFSFSTEAGGRVCWLEEIYIAPAYRNRGFGKAYLHWVLDEYRDFKRFRLEVCPLNPDAKRLYESVGFTDLGYLQLIR